jgi:hypothetical protein
MTRREVRNFLYKVATLIPIGFARALIQKQSLNHQLALSKTKQALNYQRPLDPNSFVA